VIPVVPSSGTSSSVIAAAPHAVGEATPAGSGGVPTAGGTSKEAGTGVQQVRTVIGAVTSPMNTLMSVAGFERPPAALPVDPLEQAMLLAKKKKGTRCFRCGNPGHCLNDCTTILCDCCQKSDHLTRECPLILAPKPSMIVHGVAHEELTFWEFPASGSFKPRVENTRMGRVTIHNGTMTIPQIISQLQWIVPEI
jgi:hypothetical protein